MENISLNGEVLNLTDGQTYYIIDALYLNDISKDIEGASKQIDDNYIIKEFFPFTIAPFCKIILDKSIFKIDRIKKANDEDEQTLGKYKCFSSDTGLILFIKESIFLSVASKFDYEELVDHPIDPINIEYWKSLTNGLKAEDIGLVLAPGIDSGYDFEGGGFYEIV